MKPHVLVVGAGLSGLAAAEALSRDRRVRITLVEAKRVAGGRAGSFTDSTSGAELDYCQHVAMGCCTSFVDFVDQVGLSNHFRRDDRLVFLHRNGASGRVRRSDFRATPWFPEPLHLMTSFGGLSYLTIRQKLEVAWGVWRLMRMNPNDFLDQTASAWLSRNGQSTETLKEFWEVFLVSALGEWPSQVSVKAARKVILDGFALNRRASEVLIPNRSLSYLFGKLALAALVDRGVEYIPNAPVRLVERRNDHFTVQADQASFPRVDAVICSVPWYAVNRIEWGGALEQQQSSFEKFSHFPASPISGLHLWFDRALTDLPHAVLVGSLSQWIFRSPTERDAKNADLRRGGEHYVQVVISASAAAKSLGKEDLINAVQSELSDFFPNSRNARLLRSRVVTDPKSVFSIRPEIDRQRPPVETEQPGLFLAGDWVQTGWPATMEGAIRGGRMAASAANEFLVGQSLQLPDDLPPSGLTRWLVR